MNAPIESRILHRTLSAVPPVVVSGQGMELIDAQGRRYLDACGGAAVSCLGHGHPDVQAAMHAQIDRLAWTHTGFFTTEVAEQLAATLVASAPAGMDGTCATKIRATSLLGRAVGSRAFQSMLRHSSGQCCLYSDLSRFFRSAVTTPLPLRLYHCSKG